MPVLIAVVSKKSVVQKVQTIKESDYSLLVSWSLTFTAMDHLPCVLKDSDTPSTSVWLTWPHTTGDVFQPAS